MFSLEFLSCDIEYQRLAEEFLREWESDKPFVIAHTSGSTGKPKEIKLRKEDMLASARSTNRYFGIDENSVLLSPLSATYIAGKMMIVRSIEADCKVVFTTPSNRFWAIPELQRFILATRPSLLPIVPSQALTLLDNPVGCKVTIESVGAIIIGGAPLSPDIEKRLLQLGKNFYATYGMTETCSHVALRKLGERGFAALPGISFSVDSRDCLTIHADNFSFVTLQTNDIVELVSPQSFIWRGRFDNVINSGGIKILPEEVELMLKPFLTYPFYIKGLPHPKWGESVALFTTAPSAVSDDGIMAICRANLPRHAVPTAIVRIPSLPLTTTGKLRR